MTLSIFQIITHFALYLEKERWYNIDILSINRVLNKEHHKGNKNGSYSKNISANLCKPIYGIINYSTFICPFESGTCGKERKKLQKVEHLQNKKNFLEERKNIFHSL